MGERRNAYRILVGKPERKRRLGRPRHRWVDNIKMALREIAQMGERSNAYRILGVKPEGKRPLGRPRRRWVDNIKMDLREIARMGRGGMHIGYWWESQKERDHYEDQDVGGWTILKWILERQDGIV
jgi:hypothetical protein